MTIEEVSTAITAVREAVLDGASSADCVVAAMDSTAEIVVAMIKADAQMQKQDDNLQSAQAMISQLVKLREGL